MVSMALPDHTHVCGGQHDAGDHLCSDPSCRRYFWRAPASQTHDKPVKVEGTTQPPKVRKVRVKKR